MDAQTTAALIGAAAVTGTIAGTLIGAHIQAAGGHAQAEAARDAAATAASATNRQAITERRWTALTGYLRAAHEVVAAADRLYTLPVHAAAGPDSSFEDIDRAMSAFTLLQAEVELSAPTDLERPVDMFFIAVMSVDDAARDAARELAHPATAPAIPGILRVDFVATRQAKDSLYRGARRDLIIAARDALGTSTID
ncbi:hypothetical protein OH809_39130 [Streptomyces sp. NBC_00873]|uniref:hypothetical protein n=1 Tax=unclassified Streptomyces TaxID=2593676 RepID=UPI00386F4691|nr:hypothetical protein OH809_39130 [Streptomyces sp. NBC_00873]WTA42007.1 hypothetical protein OH821_04560 [Streptomyces sp. NBC_00842]